MKTFENEFEKYNSEVSKKWGNTDAYKEHKEKTKDYSAQKWNDLADSMDSIMAEFSLCMKSANTPDSPDAQSLVRKLQSHITDNCYTCTNEILAGLGRMYTLDERFKKNIDKHSDGTAEFIQKAIKIYCTK